MMRTEHAGATRPKSAADAPARAGSPARTWPCACPACRHENLTSCPDSPDFATCERCGTLASLVPEGSYQTGYYFHDPAADRSARRRSALQIGYLEDLLPYLPGMPRRLERGLRVLEVGCAKGFFVERLIERGVDAHGVDFSEPAIAAAAERGLGDRCRVGDARESSDSDPSFDLVCAFELLEHFDQPETFLRAAASAVRPGGWIVGTTPNADSHWRKRLGAGWHGYAIPQFHRMYLGDAGFRELGRRVGLETPVTMGRTERTRDWLLLRNRATVLADRIGTRNRILRTGLAGLLAVPQAAAERRSNRAGGPPGDTLVFAARRPRDGES